MARDIEDSGQEAVTATFSKDNFCGNGSLMRVIPAALIAKTAEEAPSLARQSSMPTHPHQRCNLSRPEIESVIGDRFAACGSLETWKSKPEASIRSTGYVVDSLEAALWAFFTTNSFEEGAIAAVNLGDDADTIDAIYGGLAGAHYGFDQIPPRWLHAMRKMDLIDDVVRKILETKGLQ